MQRSLRLLIVDDEEDFLKTIVKRTERRGHEAVGVSSCLAAMEKLKTWLPDAIILDVKLPDMDGIQCLRHIKGIRPGIPVILLTGHASVHTGLEGVASGASDYCLKPVELDHLMERVIIAIEEVGDNPHRE